MVGEEVLSALSGEGTVGDLRTNSDAASIAVFARILHQ